MRPWLILLSIVVAVGATSWYGLNSISASYHYALRAEFASVPTDDEAMSAWVRSQPGVYLTYVNREQVGEHWRVEVIFGISRDGWGRPPIPSLDAIASELGYLGPINVFKDSPR